MIDCTYFLIFALKHFGFWFPAYICWNFLWAIVFSEASLRGRLQSSWHYVFTDLWTMGENLRWLYLPFVWIIISFWLRIPIAWFLQCLIHPFPSWHLFVILIFGMKPIIILGRYVVSTAYFRWKILQRSLTTHTPN